MPSWRSTIASKMIAIDSNYLLIIDPLLIGTPTPSIPDVACQAKSTESREPVADAMTRAALVTGALVT